MELKQFIDLTGLENRVVRANEIKEGLPDMEMLEVTFPELEEHKFIIYIPMEHTTEQAFHTIAGIIWEYALKLNNVEVKEEEEYINNPFFSAMMDMLDADNFLDDVNDIIGNKDPE